MKQVIIDTNIFIRFYLKDIADQAEKAKELLASIEKKEKVGLISVLVINELIWILEHYYKIPRSKYIPKLLQILAYKQIKIIEITKQRIVNILNSMIKQPIDFTDLYLLSIANSYKIFSFDKDLKKE